MPANTPKKVRLACLRCRTRRIKCDGQVPACSNCAKAGEACFDVDSQDSNVLVPRNFTHAARARIQWLEDIIKQRLLDVDLASGPSVEDAVDPRAFTDGPGPSPAPYQAQRQSSKRPVAPSYADGVESSFPECAHSVALSLGLLSLNSDSSQKHYLGSSSGVLFTNLIGPSPPSTASPPTAEEISIQSSDPEWSETGAASERAREHYQSLHMFLRQEMPTKEDALLLLQTYIRWVHPDYPVLEPSSLFSALDALYASFSRPIHEDALPCGWPSSHPSFRWNGRQVSPEKAASDFVPMPVLAFIFFMIFNIAAIVKVRSRVYDFPPEKFYRAALHFSADCFSQISFSSIQALVMLIARSLLTPTEANLWTLIHVALAHCVELGIHREPPGAGGVDLDHQELRRFTFFTIYSLDRSISSIQGRPLGFRDETFDVRLPVPRSPQLSTPHSPTLPAYSIDITRYSRHHFQLDRIVSDIKLHLYHLPNASSWFTGSLDPVSWKSKINQDLADWHGCMATDDFDGQGLQTFSRQLWRLKLDIKFHTTMIMLHQPSQAIRNPSAASIQICYDSATSVLQSYQTLHDKKNLQHGWRAVQNVFAAGATLIYAFWTSPSVRDRASRPELSKNLRTCSNMLTIGGEWWPAARRGQRSFDAVVDLTLQHMYTVGSASKRPRHSSTQAIRGGGQETTAGDLRDERLLPESNTTAQGDSTVQFITHGPDSWDRHESWLNPDSQHDHNACVPEIEDFLADFDNADFNWSFPLNDGGS